MYYKYYYIIMFIKSTEPQGWWVDFNNVSLWKSNETSLFHVFSFIKKNIFKYQIEAIM